jgi:hypothetical protein
MKKQKRGQGKWIDTAFNRCMMEEHKWLFGQMEEIFLIKLMKFVPFSESK